MCTCTRGGAVSWHTVLALRGTLKTVPAFTAELMMPCRPARLCTVAATLSIGVVLGSCLAAVVVLSLPLNLS